jgi:hypothetical protein
MLDGEKKCWHQRKKKRLFHLMRWMDLNLWMLRICSSDGIFWPLFFIFFLWSWKPDLHVSADFWLTRAHQLRSPTFSAPTVVSTCRIGRRWSVRGVHALGSSLLLGARVVTLHLFSGRARWYRVFRRRIFVWVGPVTARVGHAPPSGIFQSPLPLPAACCLGFLLFLFSVFLSCCLQSQPSCVWIKFYGNFCWQIARSALFL